MLATLPPCDLATSSVNDNFERANAHKRSNNVAGALSCYRRAIELDPAHPGSYNNLANTLKRAHGLLQCGGEPCPGDALQDASSEAHTPVVTTG